MEWIDVNEQVPTSYTPVMIAHRNNNRLGMEVSIGIYHVGMFTDSVTKDDNSDITHWCKIPIPPPPNNHL